MDRKVETIQGGYENILDGLDCEFEIKLMKKCKPKLELEIGDVIVLNRANTHSHLRLHFGKVLSFGPEDVILKWSENSNESSILVVTLNKWLKDGKIKIYKEVFMGDLNV